MKFSIHAPSTRDGRVSLCGLWWWRAIDDSQRALRFEDVTCRACLRVPARARAAFVMGPPVVVAEAYATTARSTIYTAASRLHAAHHRAPWFVGVGVGGLGGNNALHVEARDAEAAAREVGQTFMGFPVRVVMARGAAS